ncbi:octaprenyl diphosphate synthase, partial [bacterium]|nr:octaprenyl diphosphate synthase [bacterium]
YTSDEFESGKLSGIDLREGKITLPLIVALSRCNGNEYRIIKNSILADKVDTDLFNGTLQIIKKYDGLDYARNAVSKYSDKAKDALASFKMSISKESLLSLAEYVVNRCS